MTLEIQIRPLMPGSCSVAAWVLEMGNGVPHRKERRMLTVSSVFRSQWVEWGDMPRVWDTRVFPIMGIFGSISFAIEREEFFSMTDADLGGKVEEGLGNVWSEEEQQV